MICLLDYSTIGCGCGEGDAGHGGKLLDERIGDGGECRRGAPRVNLTYTIGMQMQQQRV